VWRLLHALRVLALDLLPAAALEVIQELATLRAGQLGRAALAGDLAEQIAVGVVAQAELTLGDVDQLQLALAGLVAQGVRLGSHGCSVPGRTRCWGRAHRRGGPAAPRWQPPCAAPLGEGLGGCIVIVVGTCASPAYHQVSRPFVVGALPIMPALSAGPRMLSTCLLGTPATSASAALLSLHAWSFSQVIMISAALSGSGR
jgi:hypothetical protein